MVSPSVPPQPLPSEPEPSEKDSTPQPQPVPPPPEPVITVMAPPPEPQVVALPNPGLLENQAPADPRVAGKQPVIEQPKPLHAVREDVLSGIVGKGAPLDSLQAKIELLESSVPNPPPPRIDVKPVEFPKMDLPLTTGREGEKDVRPTFMSLAPPSSLLSRQQSREDGEILSPPPLRPPPLAPRSHTPPTRPRFHSLSGTSSPAPMPSQPARRPVQTPSYRSTTQTSPANSRPLPSAPRALRTHAFSPPPSRSMGVPHHAPRGPSADRDRSDWDRERTWSGSRGRGRGSSNGWSR